MRWALTVLATVGAVAATSCATPCGPTTCDGCCTAQGDCSPGKIRTSCGAAGAQCGACTTAENCEQGRCLRRAVTDAGTSCGCVSGCCLEDGGCEPGNLVSACGSAKRACVVCGAGERCDHGACTSAPCSGCFDATGSCQSGVSALTCGRGGIPCVGCYTGEACEQGTCVARPCNPTSCPDGCCTLDAQCITNVSNAQCGTAGNDCMTCGASTTCTQGVCQ